MNPVAYCAIASCSDKDWEVFSVIFAAFVLLGLGVWALSTIETFVRKHRNKEKNMK